MFLDSPDKNMFQICKHKPIAKIQNHSDLSICKSCGYGFYNEITIIRPHEATNYVQKDIPKFIDSQVVDLFNNPVYKCESDFEIIYFDWRDLMIDQLIKRSKIMKLNEESQYLSIYLWDYFYAKNSTKYFSQKKMCDVYNATSLLIAAKMREVDLKTPYASEIRKLKDNSFTKNDLKSAEIVLAGYYDWNFLYFTVYDYVQHCFKLGILFSNDSLGEVPLVEISESVNPSTASKSKLSSPEYTSQENGSPELSPSQLDGRSISDPKAEDYNFDSRNFGEGDSPDCIPRTRYNKISSKNQKIPSQGVFVEHLKQDKQRNLVMKIEDRCMELVKQVSHEIPMVNYNQASMALAIIRYVRREFGVKNISLGVEEFWNNLFQLNHIFIKNEYQILKFKYGDPKISPNNNFTMNLRKNPTNFILKAPQIPRHNKNQYSRGKSISTTKTTLPVHSMQEIPRFGSDNVEWLEDSRNC